MEVVKHVIGHAKEAELVRVPDRLLIRSLQAKMVECNTQGLEADAGKFPQVHRVFAEDACIYALIEVYAALNGHATGA